MSIRDDSAFPWRSDITVWRGMTYREWLIGKVLEKHKFEDVARLCFFYGLPKVKRVFRRCEFEQMTRACVTRMLGNISKSLRALEEQASA
jgi:hypothetical protein